jgi:hypothetical protein
MTDLDGDELHERDAVDVFPAIQCLGHRRAPARVDS